MSESWMKRKKMERAKLLAEEHWEWINKWLHIVFVDAFVHGYKHGREEAEVEASR